jgi:hypothetical protein
VRNGEERLARRGEDRILLREIRDANGEDSPLGRRRRVEPPDVCSAEGTIPGERLTRNEPREVAMALTRCHGSQLTHDSSRCRQVRSSNNGLAPPP